MMVYFLTHIWIIRPWSVNGKTLCLLTAWKTKYAKNGDRLCCLFICVYIFYTSFAHYPAFYALKTHCNVDAQRTTTSFAMNLWTNVIADMNIDLRYTDYLDWFYQMGYILYLNIFEIRHKWNMLHDMLDSNLNSHNWTRFIIFALQITNYVWNEYMCRYTYTVDSSC